MKATYESKCTACEEIIREGAYIGRRNRNSRYVHVACLPQRTAAPATRRATGVRRMPNPLRVTDAGAVGPPPAPAPVVEPVVEPVVGTALMTDLEPAPISHATTSPGMATDLAKAFDAVSAAMRDFDDMRVRIGSLEHERDALRVDLQVTAEGAARTQRDLQNSLQAHADCVTARDAWRARYDKRKAELTRLRTERDEAKRGESAMRIERDQARIISLTARQDLAKASTAPVIVVAVREPTPPGRSKRFANLDFSDLDVN